jgi:hypothetical protein
VTGEPGVLSAHLPPRDDTPARLELENLVEEEERLAVRQDRLDRVPPEGRFVHEREFTRGVTSERRG